MANGSRSPNAIVVWVLTVVLAIVFLGTGISKLVGIGTLGLQAAAMQGFPEWMRILVGLVEIVGAIGLFIPAVAAFAAMLLALVMVPAFMTQYASHQGGVWVPLVLFILLLFLSWRRDPETVRATYQGYTARPHPLLRDGVIAGLIGAVIIAVWFLIIDTIGGHPLYTPTTLGRGMLTIFGPAHANDPAAWAVILYTIFHFAAFIFVGLIAALVVHLATREPSILLGFVILFAATEVGFYFFVSLLNLGSPLGSLAWYQVMLGNIIAAAAMGVYFWRTHRELPEQFRHSLDFEQTTRASEYHAPPGTRHA